MYLGVTKTYFLFCLSMLYSVMLQTLTFSSVSQCSILSFLLFFLWFDISYKNWFFFLYPPQTKYWRIERKKKKLKIEVNSVLVSLAAVHQCLSPNPGFKFSFYSFVTSAFVSPLFQSSCNPLLCKGLFFRQ